MKLAQLLGKLTPTGLDSLAFPEHLLGAFRRKSITFCTGVTDETTIVYWFQSRSFTIDLRLPEAAATPVCERQGWIGDTLWDDATRQLSWRIERSYQPRNQWPEPAGLSFIGNSVLEFAPTGAYVEDWRQQSCAGPSLGLRLTEACDEATGEHLAMDGGLVLAGEHAAFALSRHPRLEAALSGMRSLEQVLAERIATEEEIASYEVSVAVGGDAVTASTRADRVGQPVVPDDFEIDGDGLVTLSRVVGGAPCLLRFAVDHYVPEFAFATRTASTPEAARWMEQEAGHLLRHAEVLR